MWISLKDKLKMVVQETGLLRPQSEVKSCENSELYTTATIMRSVSILTLAFLKGYIYLKVNKWADEVFLYKRKFAKSGAKS